MAGEIPDLIAEARSRTGKGAARSARREGLVPGVVYGGGVDPLPINIPYNALLKSDVFQVLAIHYQDYNVLQNNQVLYLILFHSD